MYYSMLMLSDLSKKKMMAKGQGLYMLYTYQLKHMTFYKMYVFFSFKTITFLHI